MTKVKAYWASLCVQIRELNQWSQSRLAEELATNQETISRWERGLVSPSVQKQELIEHLAEKLYLSSLKGIANIVRCSPYPMLLCDRTDVVVAASVTSGFREGRSVLSQTPAEQHAYYRDVTSQMEEAGFWRTAGERHSYSFITQTGRCLAAIMISVGVRGQIYCLVQAVPDATSDAVA